MDRIGLCSLMRAAVSLSEIRSVSLACVSTVRMKPEYSCSRAVIAESDRRSRAARCCRTSSRACSETTSTWSAAICFESWAASIGLSCVAVPPGLGVCRGCSVEARRSCVSWISARVVCTEGCWSVYFSDSAASFASSWVRRSCNDWVDGSEDAGALIGRTFSPLR